MPTCLGSDVPLLGNGVIMREILPGSAEWQSGWDTSYAYYTASWTTPLSGPGHIHPDGQELHFQRYPVTFMRILKKGA